MDKTRNNVEDLRYTQERSNALIMTCVLVDSDFDDDRRDAEWLLFFSILADVLCAFSVY